MGNLRAEVAADIEKKRKKTLDKMGEVVNSMPVSDLFLRMLRTEMLYIRMVMC